MNENVIYRAEIADRGTHDSRSDLVMEMMEYTHWASNRQVQIWVRGFATKRYSTVEEILNKFSKNGSLRTVYQGKTKVYALRRKTKGDESTWNIPHGLACTETMLRFYLSDRDCEIVPESEFRSFGSVPEWGLLYPNSLLLGEFSTRTDTIYKAKIAGKLRAYSKNLPRIEAAYGAKAMVVFILDIPREQVKHKLTIWQPDGPYFFCDYETFLKVPIGEQLKAKIYFWTNGEEESLV